MTTKIYNNKNLPFLSACAIVAPAKKGTPLTIKKFTNFKCLLDEYGDEAKDNPLVLISKVLFLNNISTIYCIPPSINSAPTTKNYIDAFEILKNINGFYTIVCDSSDSDVISALTKTISNRSSLPRLAFVPTKDDLNESISLANKVSNPHLVLVHSKSFLPSTPEYISSSLSAAALAAVVSSIRFPLQNLNDFPIDGLILKDEPFSNSSLSSLKSCGISSLTLKKDCLAIHNLLPSKSIYSKSPSSINSLLSLDIVTTSIIRLINNIKKSSDFKILSYHSLMSQIILLLSLHKDDGLISDFTTPKINIDSLINITVNIKSELPLDSEYIAVNISV